MKERNISGLLMVTPEFVQANCEDIKKVLSYGNIEIVASNVDMPFWDVSYEEQKARIAEMLDGIENCTGIRPRIISSRYMASDSNTVKVAEELGIPYITARGTTETKATVYQPEDYNVKILSISNIPLVPFEYGSLCDYSFYERAGTPNDMKEELERALQPLTQKEKARFGQYHKITPVSHTNIGGYLKQWNDMWLEFFDNSEIEWVNLDEFMAKPDWTIPLWQIPINENNPYTEEKIKPLISYEDEEKVQNPCIVTDIKGNEKANKTDNKKKIVVFHNGQGSMCLEFLDFIKTIDYEVEQHLTTEEDFYSELNKYKSSFNLSEGVSNSFGYYPIIFTGNKAYSGFNEEIAEEILKEIK
jgi:arsenate reductase-like glutaredoxin family protein